MKHLSKGQLALIAGALILFVLLFFANTQLLPKKKETNVDSTSSNVVDFDALIAGEIKALSATDQKLEQQFSKQQSKGNDSLFVFWDKHQKPYLSGYYAGLLAEHDPSWTIKAADRLYYGARFAPEQFRMLILSKATKLYEKALMTDSTNNTIKINLAACYVEGSSDPMKGISLLREVEKVDSNNIDLQLNFAFFSLRSQQYDKAIRRFEKVLSIKPDYYEAYLHLADVYQTKGDKAKAIENLEKYKNLVSDETIKNEVQNYINKLKNT